MNSNHYFIIGITGSLGTTLTKYLLNNNNKVSGLSRDEVKRGKMLNDFDNKINIYLGDIRNKETIKSIINNIKPNVIIIAAALKFITTCEEFIWESIQTNVLGIKNIIDSCIELNLNSLEKVLFISTDKSCSPINTYGLCKALGEKLMVNASLQNTNIKFITCRYGNVLNSRGSIIPFLIELVKNKDCEFLPLTHEDMTRFFMTLEQSVELIMNSLKYGDSGDIFIPFLKSFKLIDLFKYFSNKYLKPIKIVGVRSGEKIHESLINYAESSKVIELEINNNNKVYVIRNNNFSIHDLQSKIKYINEIFEYSSDKSLSDDISFVTDFIENNYYTL